MLWLPMCTLKKNNGGFALAFTLFVLILVSVIGLGIASILIGGNKGSIGYLNNTRAFYCAKAGVSRAIAELESNSTWSPISCPAADRWNAASNSCTELMKNGSYTVTARADPNNATRVTRQWLVTSTGVSGGSTRTLSVYVQDASFADYAYFTDKEQSAAGGTIWFIGADKLTGNVHTNGFFSVMTTPQFTAQVTSSQGVVDGPLDLFYNPTTGVYSQGGNSSSNPDKFYHYATSYANDYPEALNNSPVFSFAGAEPNVALPANLSSIYNNVTQAFTGTCTLSLQTTGSGTNTVGRVNVTGCTPAGIFTIPSNYGGVFYVAGNVNISGTLKGRLTIGSSQDIHITNNILYHDKSTDVLGLATANNIWLDADPNTAANFEIDAEMMALNTSFTVTNYNTGVNRGILTIFGGLIQKNRGAVGTTSGGVVRTGYSKNYVYDTVLSNTPPPDFPTTGRIVIKAWTDSNALGH